MDYKPVNKIQNQLMLGQAFACTSALLEVVPDRDLDRLRRRRRGSPWETAAEESDDFRAYVYVIIMHIA